MDANSHEKFITVQNDPTLKVRPWLALSSGYIQRAAQSLPKLGANFPWKPKANYIEDLIHLTWGSYIEFSSLGNQNRNEKS